MADDNKYKLIGQDYTTPDLVAKVTGKAKYAEDYRADGMLFTKLLLSPMPHARVRRIDATLALAMPGVRAVLTPDDFPAVKVDPTGLLPEIALAKEPVYQGEPILAVAADSEAIAAEAIERIVVDFEPLPFAVEPLESLRPNSPNARLEGNAYVDRKIATLKWTDEDFAEASQGRLPMGKAAEEWTVGNVEEGFKNADLILDETFIIPSTAHQPLESRSAMAVWQNGKLYLYGSTQSTVQTVARVAQWVGVKPEEVVIISEYTGGGFGSKIPGAHSMAIPALLAKKTGRPVQMRISREEEHYIGRARAGFQARAKVGFRKDGRITALDLFIIMDNGPYAPQGDARSAGDMASLSYQPETMRFRNVPVLTNTPPRTSQRSPGGMQAQAIMEPILAQAAEKLGVDLVAIHAINAPDGRAPFGAPDPKTGRQRRVTGAHVRQALARGAELFHWDERKARSGKRQGSKVRGVGVAVSNYTAGSTGFDGLMTIRPDGKLYIQSGIGNLGTHSMFDSMRIAPEVLNFPWEKVEIAFGNTEKHLPWSCVSAGSQTIHAMTRANHAAALDLKKKLQEIAAKDLGGSPDDYDVANERVFRKGGGRGMTLAQAAERAVALGGKYDGHELPQDINAFTKRAAAGLVGLGAMGVARDNYPREGATQSFVIGFAEVEVDVETGVYHVVEYTAVGDVGVVVNPRSLGGQIFGGSMLGIGHAISQKFVYDQHYGVTLAKRFHHNRPPTILDAPRHFTWDAVGIPDPETPVGARGVGEPPVGAGYGSVLSALANALGHNVFRRAPVTADIILTSLEAGRPVHDPLTKHI